MSEENQRIWAQRIARLVDALPEAPTGRVRLYRIESAVPTAPKASWLMDALADAGATEATGRWFTDTPAALAFYAADAPPECPLRLVYGDAPPDQAASWRVAHHPGAGKVDPRRFSRDPLHEFFVPLDWSRCQPRIVLQRPATSREASALDGALRKRRKTW